MGGVANWSEVTVATVSAARNDPNQDAGIARTCGDLAVVGVFDGVGSTRAGRVAALAARHVMDREFDALVENRGGVSGGGGFERFFRSWWLGGRGQPGLVHRIAEEASRALEEENTKRSEVGGATLSAADCKCTLAIGVVAGQHLGVAWAGDSRVYRYTDGSLRCLTRDHAAVRKDVGWAWDEMLHFAAGSAPITRWIGPDAGAADVELLVLENGLREGDVLFACSDGFYDLAYPWEMERRAFVATLPGGDASTVLERLVQGLRLGSTDDTTVSLAAAGEPLALHGFPRCAEHRAEALGLTLAPDAGAHWRGFTVDAPSPPNFWLLLNRMMTTMARYRAVPPLAEEVAAREQGGSRRCERLLRPPSSSLRSTPRAPVAGTDGDAERSCYEVRVGVRGAAPQTLLLESSPAVDLGKVGGVIGLLVQSRDDGVALKVPVGSTVWEGLPWWGSRRIPVERLPMDVMAGTMRITVGAETVTGPWGEDSFGAGPLVVGAEKLPSGADPLMSRAHLFVQPKLGAIEVQDRGSENGSWVLLSEPGPDTGGGTDDWLEVQVRTGQPLAVLVEHDGAETALRITRQSPSQVDGAPEDEGG